MFIMIPAEKKIGRLIEVAHLYYEENLTQNEIAKRLGISRPMVSVLLSEARDSGVVTITINRVDNAQQLVEQRLEAAFPIKSAFVIPDSRSPDDTDNAVAKAAYQYCFSEEHRWKRIGVGWGSLLGRMASFAENMDKAAPTDGNVFPLIGGIGASYRSYHTNEIVRVLSIASGFSADYLYMPAFFDSDKELAFARSIEAYTSLNEKWDVMDMALVNISNYPSYPDLGVEYRFDNRLTKEKAVGRVLAYYYNISGRIIEANVDNVLQVSREQLVKTENCVAICSSLLKPQSVIGALAAGFINTIFMPQTLAEQILELRS